MANNRILIFSNDSHNLLLYSYESISKLAQLYMVSSLSKSLKPKYSWNNSISCKKIQKDTVILPFKTDVNNNIRVDAEHKYHSDGYIPDFDFMEKYIRAIEKVVIKDVVEWKDKVISATKEILN